MWFGAPVASFNWICGILSFVLVLWATVFLRVIGERQGAVAWYQRLMRWSAKRARKDGGRDVWKNPIAWREASGKRNTLGAIIGRWGFVVAGGLVALALIGLYHFTSGFSLAALRQSTLTVVSTEIAIIALTAINISATAISREREDGTLDILLTTPLTPPMYVSGKLRGIVSFLIPMLAVPIGTLGLISIYVLVGGLGKQGGVMISAAVGTGQVSVPMVLPEGALYLPVLLLPFMAFCVMVGLNWSLKSKGTIGSVIAAVGVIVAVLGVVSLCSYQMGRNLGLIGPFFAGMSPVTTTLAIVYPEMALEESVGTSLASARMALAVGAVAGAIAYAFIVAAIHRAMLGPEGRSFDRTVRKLAGTT
jgi:ABC-type transport system involved in multi-copper enzyme maturation permease subunit